jgi:PAS domain S-box-containing protein
MADENTDQNSGENVARLLYDLVAGTAEYIGDEFFRSLVQHLARALDSRYAFVAEFAGSERRVRTLAFWETNGFLEDVEYDIAGTPCETVLMGRSRLYPERVAELFPAEKELVDMEAESYLAMPLFDSHRKVMGHLAVIDDRPKYESPINTAVLQIFGSRVAAELERRRSEQALKQSEAKLSAILESTLDAIIVIGSERRIKLFNPAAEQIFGYSASEVFEKSVDHLLSVPFRELLRDHLDAVEGDSGKKHLWAPKGLSGIRADGEEVPVELTISRGRVGGETLHTIILRDINDARRTQVELARLKLETDYLQDEIKQEHDFEGIIGDSSTMKKVLRNVARVAETDSTVLITGETGVGKELIARAIHGRSRRREKPLVKVNCAALPAELIESELFGHEKGAFTGAIERRIGRFELGNNGTLFLDEVGELSLPAQAKLLRVLQEGELERVGGTTSIKVDVRLIAATNRDLAKMIEEKTFRNDLYYRLNVFPLRIPSLRDRKSDIPALTRHLMEKLSRQLGKPIDRLSSESSRQLLEYPWPGNVRELQNVLERCAILSDGPILEVPEGLLEVAPSQIAESSTRGLMDVEREHIIEVLRQTSGVIEGGAGAAAVLGMAPSTLRSRMKKLGIRRGSFQ